jgi:gamma-glutamylcyclotransferase (GGCT)/AIG2-like uncharacterized protein YtfP/predicted glutamine amidotransferase
MCLIIYKPNHKSKIPSKYLSNAKRINPDGFGILYLDNGELIKTLDYKSVDALVNVERPFVAHFRYATQGKINKKNIHPAPCAIGHVFSNGTVPLGCDKVSDTRVVAGYLESIPREHWATLLSMTDTRFVVVDKELEVLTYGKWYDKKGVFYSKDNCFKSAASWHGSYYTKDYYPTDSYYDESYYESHEISTTDGEEETVTSLLHDECDTMQHLGKSADIILTHIEENIDYSVHMADLDEVYSATALLEYAQDLSGSLPSSLDWILDECYNRIKAVDECNGYDMDIGNEAHYRELLNVPELPANGELVAVYGTLKRGGGNDRLFTDSDQWLGAGRSVDRLRMEDKGIPYTYEGDHPEGHQIVVEVVEVNSQSTWSQLDSLEGVPTHYHRELTDVQLDNGEVLQAWMYYATHDAPKHAEWTECYNTNPIPELFRLCK